MPFFQAEEGAKTKLAVAFWCPSRQEAWQWNEGHCPSASLIKLPLAIVALQQMEAGLLDPHEKACVPPLPEDDEAEWDDLGRMPPGHQASWTKMVDRALTESDNAATNALIARLGLGAIAPLTQALGLEHTALRRRMLDGDARKAGQDNTTSPVDMVRLMTALVGGQLLGPPATAQLMAWMGQQRHRDQMAPGLSHPWRFFHKTGELPGLRADAGWLCAGDGALHAWVAAIAQGPEEALCSQRLTQLMQAILARETEHLARQQAFEVWKKGLVQVLDPRLSTVQVEMQSSADECVLAGFSTEAAALVPPSKLGLRVEAVVPVPKPMAVVAPVLFLRSQPSSMANLDDQGRFGDRFELLWDPEHEDRWVFGRLEDGYLGWAKKDHLQFAPDWAPSHQLADLLCRVGVMGLPDFQLSAASRLRARADGGWEGPGGLRIRLPEGTALRALNAGPGGPQELVAFAKGCLGLPYLWGGTSAWGLDCSGLVQLAHRLYGADLRRDADQQQAQLEGVADWRELMPGDLCFFPGHVGMMVGPGRFVHATNGVGFCTENSFEATETLFHPGLAASFTGGGRSPLAARSKALP